MIQGLVKEDRNGQPLRFDSIEPLASLDVLDLRLRLEELAGLKDGWLDGKGLAPAKDDLAWFAAAFETSFDPGLPLPYLYPTAEGGIQAEWSLTGWEVSLEIDLAKRQAEYQALNLRDHSCTDLSISLASREGWLKVNDALKNLVKQEQVVGN